MKKLLFIKREHYADAVRLLQSNGINPVNVNPSAMAACIEDVLFHMGVPKNTMGYKFLVCAIEIEVLEPSAITKVIYPEVSKRLSAKVANVERNIRFTIERAWVAGPNVAYRKYFQHPFERPTNSVFITTVAQIIRELLAEDTAES